MSEFQLSTQSQYWNLSQEKQIQIKGFIENSLKNQTKEQILKINTLPFHEAEGFTPDNETLEELRIEEIVLQHFSQFIRDGCGPQSSLIVRPWRVSNTAVIFFRRFYLCNSLKVHDPRLVMLASLFLAGKIEECGIAAEELIEKIYPAASIDVLMKTEQDLLNALNFQLCVYHPQTNITTFLTNFRTQFPSIHSDVDRAVKQSYKSILHEWENRAGKEVENFMNTPASLEFNPAIIALCSLLRTEPEPGILPLSFTQYLNKSFGHETAIHFLSQAEYLRPHFLQIDSKEVRKEAVQKINARAVWRTNKKNKTVK